MDKFDNISRQVTKKTGAYKEYLTNLKNYLVSFMERTRPMYDLNAEFKKSDSDIDKGLDEGTLPGWSLEKAAGMQPTAIDLTPYGSATELEGLGLERLKGALMAMGLKCGG